MLKKVNTIKDENIPIPVDVLCILGCTGNFELWTR